MADLPPCGGSGSAQKRAGQKTAPMRPSFTSKPHREAPPLHPTYRRLARQPVSPRGFPLSGGRAVLPLYGFPRPAP